MNPGSPLAQWKGAPPVILELNVTPNRADCLSHIGLAFELSTLLHRPVQLPEISFQEEGESTLSLIQVEVKDSEACPRFCGRMIRGVKIAPSPPWLEKALNEVGVNPVNNVVDVTNYVLFEYGQPLHAYDFNRLEKPQIMVEKAKPGECFTSLDGTEIRLTAQDLVIRDGARAVGIAGVVGGQNTGVLENTQDIFLEAAFFAPEGVRRTARAHGIETEAGYRFSRGVDPNRTLEALNRAASLIQEVAGGRIQQGHVDLYPQPLSPPEIAIKTSYVEQRLGLSVEEEDFMGWMKRLYCQVIDPKVSGFTQKPKRLKAKGTSSGDQTPNQEQELIIIPPSFRWDLKIKEDLVEEYARLRGYDTIKEKLPPMGGAPSPHNLSYQWNQRVGEILVGLGLDECLNYALIPSGQHQKIWGETGPQWGLSRGERAIELLNPISEELALMRESLLPSLLKNLVYNHHHGNHRGRLFERAQVSLMEGENFKEESRLALLFWGSHGGIWESPRDHQVVFELKSTLETLLKSIGGRKWRWENLTMELCPPGFHPSQTLSLFYEGKTLGLLGTMHPALVDEHKIKQPVAWAELNLEGLMEGQPRFPRFKALGRFPGTERDIAFVVPEKMMAQEIETEIKKWAGPLLTQLQVFDLYQDKELQKAGRQSMAFRLHFQSFEKTLQDEEVNKIRDQVVEKVCTKLDLQVR